MDVATVVPGVPGRVIRFVQAAEDGTFDANAWRTISHGRSVVELRAAVAEALEEPNAIGLKLCARPRLAHVEQKPRDSQTTRGLG